MIFLIELGNLEKVYIIFKLCKKYFIKMIEKCFYWVLIFSIDIFLYLIYEIKLRIFNFVLDEFLNKMYIINGNWEVICYILRYYLFLLDVVSKFFKVFMWDNDIVLVFVILIYVVNLINEEV